MSCLPHATYHTLGLPHELPSMRVRISLQHFNVGIPPLVSVHAMIPIPYHVFLRATNSSMCARLSAHPCLLETSHHALGGSQRIAKCTPGGGWMSRATLSSVRKRCVHNDAACGAAAWISRKQAIQGLSSVDVETYAASAAAADLLHQRGLLQELGVPFMQSPTTIWCDNAADPNL